MTTFTKTQISALITATNAACTVEEYAAQMGFTIAAEAAVVAAKATRSARPVGQTSVVVLSSANNATLLVTTNTGFAGRSDAWIVADWVKTVAGSRKSDTRFAQLVHAEDLTVYASDLLACATAEDKQQVEEAVALVVAQYVNNGYTVISKIKRTTQVLVDAQLALVVAEVTSAQVQSYYNAVQGATGATNAYKYNAKTKKFAKVRK